MGQQVNVYRKLKIWPGASVEGLGFQGMGNTYYVDQNTGSNTYQGTDPQYPKKSIQAGMDCVTDNHDDYVFVLSSKDEDDTLGVVPTDDLLRWHLIGINVPPNQFGTVIRLDASVLTLDAITLHGTAGSYSEITGFSLGGGATNCGGIGFGQTMGLWVHHNTFGSRFNGDTPAHGINFEPSVTAGTNCEGTVIEDNMFLGNANNCKGLITDTGIYLTGTPSWNMIIRRNIFMGLPGYGMNVSLYGGMILDNIFMLDDDTAGAAIFLQDTTLGTFVNGNSANDGDTDAMSANPYVDDAASNVNTWGLNYKGGEIEYPA